MNIMTINIVVKCPEGLVLGSDSLTTITDNSGNIVSSIPYTSKLFSLGIEGTQDKSFAVGALINGFHSIGGIRIEDIIEEFEEIYANTHSSSDYEVSDLAEKMANHIQHYIETGMSKDENINLEIILAGFSRTKKNDANSIKKQNRYGEIYSYLWEDTRTPRLRPISVKDGEFTTFYGGQPAALDRFRYGIDEWVLYRMLYRKDWLYEQVRYYIYNQLKKESKDIPEILKVEAPNNLSEYNIFQLFSSGQQGKTAGETIRNVKEGMKDKLNTMEGMFSLQTAVNYCNFLLSCAYAHSAFTFVLPVVGSEMRVASITRREGFKFRKVWEIQTPSAPFH
jgi:hypothetical protein